MCLLVAFLFYSDSQSVDATRAAVDQIVAWQRGTDTLMASCVSIEVMKLVVDALERDRSLYRQMLPGHTPAPPADPQPQAQPQPHRHDAPQAWRRFAHNVAWFALIIAIVVVVMVLLSR